MRPVLLCACIFVFVLALAGCGGGNGASVAGEPISFAQLSRAATSSADAGSGQFAFSFEASLPETDEPFAFGGAGAFDASTKRSRFSFDFASLAKLLGDEVFGGFPVSGFPDFDDKGAWQLEAVQEGDVSYVRFPALSSQLPAGKSWVRADSSAKLGAQGLDLTPFKQFDGGDRRKLLDYLRAASGEIETVGTEKLRGVPTTHYRAIVDLAEYARLVPSAERQESGTFLGDALPADGAEVPVDVWLDEFGLVRMLTMSVSADGTDAVMRFELWDYGKDVEIDLPPAAQVVDAADLD